MENTPIKIYCNSCRRTTNHIIVKQEEREIHDDEAQAIFYDSWDILKCLGCETISFRHLSSNSDNYDPETGAQYETVRLYPIRSDKSFAIKPYYNVPAIVRNIYRETLDAYNNGLNLLSAAGLRAIIESICSHENIRDGLVQKDLIDGTTKAVRTKNLMGKINGLQENGIITKKQVSILHEHRYLGNDALHSLDTPDKKVLGTAIEIIEHVLDLLYEIDQKAGELMRIRQLKEKRRKAAVKKGD
ncbi:MAG: DUF4145 domain-containing protein [Nitrosopumilus sp.]|nr:DUF4145 domain-containing protein [Nitrosopumilus sp.]